MSGAQRNTDRPGKRSKEVKQTDVQLYKMRKEEALSRNLTV